MGLLEIVAIGISLAMDAFAVSICKGLSMKKLNEILQFSDSLMNNKISRFELHVNFMSVLWLEQLLIKNTLPFSKIRPSNWLIL